MLNVKNINVKENNYEYYSKKISFKSKFEPNFALKTAFQDAKNDISNAIFRSSEEEYYRDLDFAYKSLCDGRVFVRIIKNLLNDGKDDLIKVVMSKKNGTSSLYINSKKVNKIKGNSTYYNDLPKDNIIDYFSCQTEIVPNKKLLSLDELKLIQNEVNILNSDLNADDAIKNPTILHNLNNNIANVYRTLAKYTRCQLDELEAKIFNI